LLAREIAEMTNYYLDCVVSNIEEKTAIAGSDNNLHIERLPCARTGHISQRETAGVWYDTALWWGGHSFMWKRETENETIVDWSQRWNGSLSLHGWI